VQVEESYGISNLTYTNLSK